MKVKCYLGNYDGRRRGLVVAQNQKEAAKIVRTSLYSFRQYWTPQVNWPMRNPKPFTLYLKPYDADDNEWVEQ